MPNVARKLRIEYAGAIYHVMNRGDRREPIFRDDRDRVLFLETLGQACGKTDWQVHAWCLMLNHFHLVIETPKANLVAGMKWLLGTYTGRFNRKHQLSGHLFGGRYKALIVDGSGNGYLRTVCDYVHLNPVRAKQLRQDQKLRAFRWSRMELRRWEDQPEQWKGVRRGWCLGGDAFRKELLAQMAEQAGTSHYGEELRESAEEKAQRIVAEEMKRLGWKEDELRGHRKGHRLKVKIARRLRQETTMTLQWIADRLQMGTWTHVANRLHHQKN